MPSQLYKNEAVTFLCGRSFTYGDHDYDLLDEFDQEVAVGRLEMLVRTRHIIPVIDSIEDKPRHWHREIRLREDVERALGAQRGQNQIVLEAKEPVVEPDVRVDEPVAEKVEEKKPVAKKTAKKKA